MMQEQSVIVTRADVHSFFLQPVRVVERNVGGKRGWRMTLAFRVSVVCVVACSVCQNQLISFYSCHAL